MEIEIKDPCAWLSKNQKAKIRESFKDGKPAEEIIDQIHYEDPGKGKYKTFKEEKISDTKSVLVFSDQLDSKDNVENEVLREKLKNRLEEKEMSRRGGKNEAWKMYHDIIAHPSIRSLPDETIKNAIPNPDEVKSKRDIYHMINKVNPNPMIKKYIQLCMESK
jgi:hypothetical protein